MADISITVDSKGWEKYLHSADGRVREGLSWGIKRGALIIEREAKKLIAAGYFKHPTGRLMNSINIDLNYMSASIGPHVNYAIYVHNGTRYIKPHPFMTDTAAKFGHDVQKTIEDSIQERL